MRIGIVDTIHGKFLLSWEVIEVNWFCKAIVGKILQKSNGKIL